jgi:hypothetical protein
MMLTPLAREAAAIKVDGGGRNLFGLGGRLASAEAGAAAIAVLALLAAIEGVLLQGEFEIGLGAVEAGLLQRLFQAPLVALHQVERFGLFHGQAGMDLAGGVNIKTDIDTAQFGRVEPDLEAGIAIGWLGAQLQRPVGAG